MSKSHVFKKGSPQQKTLFQNTSQGYIAVFRILSFNHLVTAKDPHLLI